MRQVFAIIQNTFREAIRDRILYGFLFFAIALILFSLVLGQLSLNQKLRSTIDIGLMGISFVSVLISIFLGITLLNKEIEKRTIYPVLAKPVSRVAYVIGKYFGLVSVVLVQMSLMLLVFFPLVYFQGGTITAGLVVALLLIFVETLVIVAMALFFTSFSSPFLSGIFSLGLFVAGRNAHLIAELAQRKDISWLSPFLDVVAVVTPNLYLFYPSGKIVEDTFATVHAQFVSTGYLVSTIGYGVALSAAFVTLSILLIRRRDFL
ncbi:MAG: ABC transporter permease [Myxococcales bacterium]|jgi:ABC-type transport system involved in multi-copper enzyme maturation permease subunit|nr:ABC transporter permease [Myxococcales bacterium]